MEMIHNSQYPEAFKICSRFVSKSWTRPILTMINHASDGSMIATDSHRAIRIKNIHGFEKNYLIHPKTIEVAVGDYPDVERFIPQQDEKTLITLSNNHLDVWLQMFKSINQMKNLNRNKVVKMFVKDDEVTFEVSGIELNFSLPFQLAVTEEDTKIAFSIEYMRDALQVFKNMKSKEVNILLHGLLRPFVLKDCEKTEVIILPVRNY